MKSIQKTLNVVVLALALSSINISAVAVESDAYNETLSEASRGNASVQYI